MSRIFIVGSGTVGTATGKALGHAGHRVTFIDIDPHRVAVLVGEGLDARADLCLAGEPESFIFLCTPTRVEGERHHLADVAGGAEVIGRALARADCPHTVVVRSTVPPGTTRDLVRPLIELHSGRHEGSGFAVAASPYFDSRPRLSWSGRRLPEPARLPLTVIGADTERVMNAIRDLLSPLVPAGGQIRLLDDPAEAEMVKCVHSLFNATKISFWNEIWRVCDRLAMDPDEIAEMVATSAEGSLNPEYGIWGGVPYGGRQLPGDTQGFLGYAEEIGLPMPLLSAVVGVNAGFQQRLDAELDAMSMMSCASYHYATDPWSRSPGEPLPDARNACGANDSETDEEISDAPELPQLPVRGLERPVDQAAEREVHTDAAPQPAPRRRLPRRPWIPRQLGR